MDCKIEGQLYIDDSSFQLTLLICHVSMSLGAFITNIWFWRTQFSKIFFHSNLKNIIFLSILFNILHSVALAICQTVHLINYKAAADGCSIGVPPWFCYTFRGMTTVIELAYSPLFVAKVIERIIATVNIANYEHSKSKFCYYFIGTMLSAAGFLYFSYKNLSLPEKSMYCSGVTWDTSDDVALAGYIQTAVEGAAILGLLLVLVANQRLDKRNLDNKLKYQVRENLAALKLLVPWSLVHWFIFTFLYLSDVLLPIFGTWEDNMMNMRTTYALIYTVPLYCLISPYLLACIAWKQRRTRDAYLKKISTIPANTAAYEKYLENQWA